MTQRFSSDNSPQQNNPGKLFLNEDGQVVDGEDVWTEAKPHPFYRDGRPFIVRLWHVCLYIPYMFWCAWVRKEDLDDAEDRFEGWSMKKWWREE